MNINRQQRTVMAHETLAICKTGQYQTTSGKTVIIDQDLQNSLAKSYLVNPEEFNSLRQSIPTAVTQSMIISVVNQSTLMAARDLLNAVQEEVVCLNFASAKNPGGGFLNGSEAQEESLARSSALYPTLLQHPSLYNTNRKTLSCLYTDTMIVSPSVPVFRDDDGNLLEQPYPVTFITSPAVNAGAVRNNEPGQVANIEPVMASRMEKLLCVCAAKGFKHLVLGAWGCGVFMNDPGFIAQTWKNLLATHPLYMQRFNNIVFAVLDRKDRGTYQTFKNIFS